MNGKRSKLRRIMSDPSASMVVVEHSDRLSRPGVEHLEAALSVQGGRGARTQAMRAVTTATKREAVNGVVAGG